MPSEPQRESLPFEPKSSKQSSSKAASSNSSSAKASPEPKKSSPRKTSSAQGADGSQKDDGSIPEVVSRRMMRRMAETVGRAHV